MADLKLYPSYGVLRYEEKDGKHRVVVEGLDEELIRYYRSLIPWWKPANKPKYSPHITVVRIHKEAPADLTRWGEFDGEAVEFLYEPRVYHGPVYYWLNIWCSRLEEIRESLGMPVTSPFTRPPDGFRKCFHTTLANKKVLA